MLKSLMIPLAQESEMRSNEDYLKREHSTEQKLMEKQRNIQNIPFTFTK